MSTGVSGTAEERLVEAVRQIDASGCALGSAFLKGNGLADYANAATIGKFKVCGRVFAFSFAFGPCLLTLFLVAWY